ncbi:DUF4336 domain-containing protein [Jiella marina]|uniref:DUF4336 domain-containing protein n=1 Tax=Jiella sp. LLJ827 TaxID=2917712 RepID=UPI00210076E4|nr:DUF4336 domain-containing protein [Jiella sp. LLJ827]MCQ0987913.1 DUF4336 domain-containing protein [Jiella sp. LLJ827]
MMETDDKPFTYEPLNVLKPVAEDLWLVDGPAIDFRYLGLDVPFPTRMTIVRLADGGLWLHSPIAAEPALLDKVQKLGPVAHLIAPNTLHYWYVPDWTEIFPEAEVHYAPGLPEKAKRPLPDGLNLESAAPATWSGAIDQVVVTGDILNEVVFFHRKSRTLILTDLIENFEPERVKSFFLRNALKLAGASDPDGKAPIDMRLTFARHKAALRDAVRQMIAWAPEQVVLAHGRWYETNGTAELRRAFRWVL